MTDCAPQRTGSRHSRISFRISYLDTVICPANQSISMERSAVVRVLAMIAGVSIAVGRLVLLLTSDSPSTLNKTVPAAVLRILMRYHVLAATETVLFCVVQVPLAQVSNFHTVSLVSVSNLAAIRFDALGNPLPPIPTHMPIVVMSG